MSILKDYMFTDTLWLWNLEPILSHMSYPSDSVFNCFWLSHEDYTRKNKMPPTQTSRSLLVLPCGIVSAAHHSPWWSSTENDMPQKASSSSPFELVSYLHHLRLRLFGRCPRHWSPHRHAFAESLDMICRFGTAYVILIWETSYIAIYCIGVVCALTISLIWFISSSRIVLTELTDWQSFASYSKRWSWCKQNNTVRYPSISSE